MASLGIALPGGPARGWVGSDISGVSTPPPEVVTKPPPKSLLLTLLVPGKGPPFGWLFFARATQYSMRLASRRIGY